MKKLILAVPLLIISLVVASIALLLLKLWVWAVIVLAFIYFLNWWSETFALNSPYQQTGHYDFRILTFNVNRAYEISVNKGSTEELIKFILKQHADIVLLQEYNAELYPSVQEELEKEYLYGSGLDSKSRFKSVFSRFPIESCEQLMVDSSDPRYEVFQNAVYCKKRYNGQEILPICKVTIRTDERILQIFNCHLMSNNYSVVIRNLRKKGKSLIHGILPILHRMDFGYKARELQAKVIGEHVDKNMPTLICGDFNDVGGSSSLRILQRHGFADAWWKGGFGFGFTFHGMGLRFRLDHVLYSSKDMILSKVKVPHSEVSDHDPMVCNFSFR